jgi:hypothetical protein
MDIQIQRHGQNRIKIEAKTKAATDWLTNFAWFREDEIMATIEIDAEALEEYEKAARAAGLEVS